MAIDKSMDDELWLKKTNRVIEWMEHNELPDGRKEFVGFLINFGNDNPDMRKVWWASITACFRDVANQPFGGRPPVWGDEIDAIVNNLLAGLRETMMEVYETNTAIGAMVLPHGKSRFHFYTAETYADTICKTARFNLLRAYNNHHNKREGEKYYWDGSFSNGLPDVYTEHEDIIFTPTRSRKK